MVSGKTKKIVVIRDIPSNFIEEAILILRGEPEAGEQKNSSKPPIVKINKENDFLVKEAQLIIDNYVKESKLQAALRRDAELNKGLFGRMFATGFTVYLALMIILILLAVIIITTV
jgi:hypothetical protein